MNINFPKAIVCKDFKSWYFSHSSFQGEIEWHQRENPGSFKGSHDLIFKTFHSTPRAELIESIVIRGAPSIFFWPILGFCPKGYLFVLFPPTKNYVITTKI